mgnify:CR=1 FL=1
MSSIGIAVLRWPQFNQRTFPQVFGVNSEDYIISMIKSIVNSYIVLQLQYINHAALFTSKVTMTVNV